MSNENADIVEIEMNTNKEMKLPAKIYKTT